MNPIRKRLKTLRRLLEQQEPEAAVPSEGVPSEEPPPEEEPSFRVADLVRSAAMRLERAPRDNMRALMDVLTGVLEQLDKAVEAAGGKDTDLGRKLMNIARQFDGFSIGFEVQLRAPFDGFDKPSTLRWVMSLPEFPEKDLDGAAGDLADLADEIETGGVG